MSTRPHDYVSETLDFYHKLLGDVLTYARQGTPATLTAKQKELRITWAYLNEARVFAFDPETYMHLYVEADRYTTEVMAGVKYVPAGEGKVDEEEATKLFDLIMWEGKNVSFPKDWPFETIFIGFGIGVHVSAADFMIRQQHYSEVLGSKITGAFIRGYLISTKNHGNVWEIVEYQTQDRGNAVVPEYLRSNGVWVRSYSLVPWITQGLQRLLSSYRKFIEEQKYTTNEKYERSKQAKRVKGTFVPRPYYVVKLTNKLIEEHERKAGNAPHYRYNYRFDVRGHERIRVRRGRLPLDAKLEAKLRKRGYQVFIGSITDDFIRKLFERHITPKNPNEWIAVLSTWVDNYQKGPDEAPYIPAIRTPNKGKSE